MKADVGLTGTLGIRVVRANPTRRLRVLDVLAALIRRIA